MTINAYYEAAIIEVLREMGIVFDPALVRVTFCRNPAHGDLTTNVLMVLNGK